MKFRSAVDTWFYLLALGVPGAIFIFAVLSVGTADTAALVVIGITAIIGFGLPVWLLLSTYYVVEANTLKIRSGPFGWSILISEIKSVRPSRSVLSSPALSLKRLEIQYGRGQSILVSPEDFEGFKNAIGQD
jgi:hypothetical protein